MKTCSHMAVSFWQITRRPYLTALVSNRNARAESLRLWRAGEQAEGAWGVSPANLPPGGRAVCGPPRHSGSHAREGRHNGERVSRPCICDIGSAQCVKKPSGENQSSCCTCLVNNVWSHLAVRLVRVIILWWPWSITLETTEQPQAGPDLIPGLSSPIFHIQTHTLTLTAIHLWKTRPLWPCAQCILCTRYGLERLANCSGLHVQLEYIHDRRS